jgi:hypothetical protein
MICKLQRSIDTNLPKEQILIYNEDRSWLFTGNLPDDIRKFMGKKFKMFVRCHLFGTEIVIDYETHERSW